MIDDLLSGDLSYRFDEALREVAASPADMHRAIHVLQGQLDQPALETRQGLQILGRIGIYARILHDFTTAEQVLREAIALGEQADNPIATLVNELRLAHVYQWRGQYNLSNQMFMILIARCEQQPALADYLDFIYQHAGKNAFDQGLYADALAYFEQAWTLRRQKQNQGLLASTNFALSIVRR